jgi:CheY-like chemotaxis protein
VPEELESAGCRVLTAPDGQAGLRWLQSNARIDLLLTDVGLPGGLNGRQVADAGRVSRPVLKVPFITGYAESAAVRNGLLGEGMEVVTKPFAPVPGSQAPVQIRRCDRWKVLLGSGCLRASKAGRRELSEFPAAWRASTMPCSGRSRPSPGPSRG